MTVQRELRGITPLLQAELTKQLGKVTDALDNDDLNRAFRCVKTLITISPPKVKMQVVADLDLVEAQIEKARCISRVDLKQTRTAQRFQITSILRKEIRPLFNLVMNLLYEGGYLEQYKREVPSNVPSDFFQKTQ